MASDDLAHPELPCSQLAWWGLIMGVEHLDGTIGLLDHQTDQGESILPTATYTVLRGALLGASQAALLLCTPQRSARIDYALRIAHEEYRQVFNFRKETVNHAAVSETQRQAVVNEDFLGYAENGMRRVKDLIAKHGGTTTKLNDTDMIGLAAKLVHRGSEANLLQLAMNMEWRLGSGSAHGRLLMNMQRPQGSSPSSDGETAYFSTSRSLVIQQIATVFLTLNQAWRMWDLRKSPNSDGRIQVSASKYYLSSPFFLRLPSRAVNCR